MIGACALPLAESQATRLAGNGWGRARALPGGLIQPKELGTTEHVNRARAKSLAAWQVGAEYVLCLSLKQPAWQVTVGAENVFCLWLNQAAWQVGPGRPRTLPLVQSRRLAGWGRAPHIGPHRKCFGSIWSANRPRRVSSPPHIADVTFESIQFNSTDQVFHRDEFNSIQLIMFFGME